MTFKHKLKLIWSKRVGKVAKKIDEVEPVVEKLTKKESISLNKILTDISKFKLNMEKLVETETDGRQLRRIDKIYQALEKSERILSNASDS